METPTMPPTAISAIDGWLTLVELRERWKVSKHTIQRLRKSGRLPALQITPALYRFKLSDILRVEAEGVMLPAITVQRKPSKKTKR